MASGSGTNAQNLARHFKDHPFINVALIISNKANAYVLERAKQESIPAVVISKEQWKDPNQAGAVFKKYDICFVVLAGYLLLIPHWLIQRYPNRIINIHPALLPRFGGKGMYGDHVHKAVIASGERESGITIHYVNEKYDEGDIVFQARCPVIPSDTPETLAKRIQQLEHTHYPQVVEGVVRERTS